MERILGVDGSGLEFQQELEANFGFLCFFSLSETCFILERILRTCVLRKL